LILFLVGFFDEKSAYVVPLEVKNNIGVKDEASRENI